jgi:hypothetical protein
MTNLSRSERREMFGTESRYASPRGLLFAVLVAACGLPTCQFTLHAQPCSLTNPPCVLTAQYGNLRQSWNGNEIVLNTSNGKAGTPYVENQ